MYNEGAFLSLEHVHSRTRPRTGGKAFYLAELARAGFTVPDTLVITTDTYDAYVNEAGLRDRILFELARKDFEDMRWEELWDAALRIRNLFLKASTPENILVPLRQALINKFNDRPVVVRSSAPGEDEAETSFAGLHESYVNVRGIESILDHVKLVWASLWSDAALLYRRELNLDIEKSRMAVVIQEIIPGDRSGVSFSESPGDPSTAVIEAVHGLNQGLVDGTVEPDRWIIDRNKEHIIKEERAVHHHYVVPNASGVATVSVPTRLKERPPLTRLEAIEVYRTSRTLEHLFGTPQDTEWTFSGSSFYLLQSRPITTSSKSEGDQRTWYLSLRRSIGNLKALKDKIENVLLPGMSKEAKELASIDVTTLPDLHLAEEIGRRTNRYEAWKEVYNNDLIPFAHGFRLFGKVYNDTINPSDPFEFVNLLSGAEMTSIERNDLMERMASHISNKPDAAKALSEGDYEYLDETLTSMIDTYMRKYALPVTAGNTGMNRNQKLDDIVPVILQLSKFETETRAPVKTISAHEQTAAFLNRFHGEQKKSMEELLQLARASYRIRDDDNVYLSKIEAQMLCALEEGMTRLNVPMVNKEGEITPEEVIKALNDPNYKIRQRSENKIKAHRRNKKIRPRQIIGQPAGPGLGQGLARVIRTYRDIKSFQAGEILVCDAIDPSITFLVPLAAGIVERRGGMLIHGAIIAREYGLPCVTGIPKATEAILSGDLLTVDGYLGIVIIGRPTVP